MGHRQIYIDCDGVLGDFDRYFFEIAGVSTSDYEELHGAAGFWKFIQDHGKFFDSLPKMEGAEDLVNALRPFRPIILTGCPRGDWSQAQKVRWAESHFPGIPMVTTASYNKRSYCQPGDVLIDDYTRYQHLWEEAGGIFVHHTTTMATLEQLVRLGVLE